MLRTVSGSCHPTPLSCHSLVKISREANVKTITTTRTYKRTNRGQKQILQYSKIRQRTHEGNEYKGIWSARNLEELYALFGRVQRSELEIGLSRVRVLVYSIRQRKYDEAERTFGLRVTEYISVTRVALAQRGFSGVEVVLHGNTMHVRMTKAEAFAARCLKQAVSNQTKVEGAASAEIDEKRRDRRTCCSRNIRRCRP